MITPVIDQSKVITWKQWIDEKDKAGIQLKIFSGSVEEAVEELESTMTHFKKYCFVKKVQEKFFIDKIEALKGNTNETYAVMQIDFAENYSITHQNEIQAAH